MIALFGQLSVNTSPAPKSSPPKGGAAPAGGLSNARRQPFLSVRL
jgi:hypothetical protein